MSVYNAKLKKPNRSKSGKPIARLVIWQTCDNPAHLPTHDPRNYNEACGRIQGHIMARSRWERLYGAWKAAGKLPDLCPCRECNAERREAARWDRMRREALAQYSGPTMSEQEARALQQRITGDCYEVVCLDGVWFLEKNTTGPDYEFIFHEHARQRCKYVAAFKAMLYEVEEGA